MQWKDYFTAGKTYRKNTNDVGDWGRAERDRKREWTVRNRANTDRDGSGKILVLQGLNLRS